MKNKLKADAATILAKLRSQSNPKNIAGMARFGISVKGALGLSMPFLRSLGKQIGTDHALAIKLWRSGVHEARILAGLIADPKLTDRKLMESWVKDFNSWDICDQVCMNLFDKTPFAFEQAVRWAKNEKEFVKRAGFALMAVLASHRRDLPEKEFMPFLPLIKKGAADERNFVKKAVNWALRQYGKRNLKAQGIALRTAREILSLANSAKDPAASRSARWVANDAIRELTNPKVIRRLK